LAAALVASTQIVGGLLVARVRRLFARRTHALIVGVVASVVLLAVIGLTPTFWIAVAALTLWGIIGAIEEPMRRAFINPLIPSQQRATVLSFDALMGSAGGVVIQPALGRGADLFGYGISYVIAAAIQALAIPFTVLSRLEDAKSDGPDVSLEEEEAAASAA